MIFSTNNALISSLTGYEKSLFYYSKFGDSNVIGIAILDSDQETLLDENLVRKAMLYMKKRHPLFRANVDHDPISKSVNLIIQNKYTDDVDLEWCQINSRTFLTKKLEEFNSKLFEYEKDCLLWRCKVIEFKENDMIKYCLALVLPLYITDGINITTLIIEVVNIINSILNNKECEEMRIHLDLIDNLHVLSSKYNLFTDKQKKVFNELKEHQNNSFKLADKFKCFNEIGLKINLIRMDKFLSDRLIKLSKQNQVKVTGFINTAIIYALRELYQENNLAFPEEISCGMPANLRLRYQPNLDFSHIRFQVCLAHLNLSYPFFGEYKSIWKDSAYVDDLIAKSTSIDDGKLFLTTHDKMAIEHFNRLFEECIDRNRNVCEKMSETNHCDLILSNIGRYVNDRKKLVNGKFKISEIYYGDSLISNPNMLSALILHVSNWNGEIQMLLSSNLAAIGSVFVNRLIYLFKKILLESLC